MRAVLRIRREPAYRREAFEKGLQRVGFTLVDKASPADASDWLVLWNRQGAAELEADAWEARGGTVIVCENGYLQKVDKTHYAISVHGHNGSGWFPFDPVEDRFTKLEFALKPWQNNENGHWLVCGQRGIGSREMKSPPGWGEKAARKLKDLKVGPVRLRLHPGNFAPRVPLLHDLKGARRCIVWSSAAGVQALVEGIFTTYSAPHWICAGSGPEWREEPLNRMAHNQWHFDEIAQGTPFARIIEHRKEASW